MAKGRRKKLEMRKTRMAVTYDDSNPSARSVDKKSDTNNVWNYGALAEKLDTQGQDQTHAMEAEMMMPSSTTTTTKTTTIMTQPDHSELSARQQNGHKSKKSRPLSRQQHKRKLLKISKGIHIYVTNMTLRFL